MPHTLDYWLSVVRHLLTYFRLELLLAWSEMGGRNAGPDCMQVVGALTTCTNTLRRTALLRCCSKQRTKSLSGYVCSYEAGVRWASTEGFYFTIGDLWSSGGDKQGQTAGVTMGCTFTFCARISHSAVRFYKGSTSCRARGDWASLA